MPVQRVLIVDDNEDQARTLAMLLERPGRDVRHATSPLYALDLVRSWVPQVIFLDLGMPHMDGYEAAPRAAGFQGHFQKPVAAETLEQLLG